MTHANPAAADSLNSPDHSKGHRVYECHKKTDNFRGRVHKLS